MKKIENLNSNRFKISENEMDNLKGGIIEYHRFLWWTWNKETNMNTGEVCRNSDPKKQGLTEDEIKSGLYTEFIPGEKELIIE